MINGAHVVIYSADAEADRAFFRDVLNFPAVDAGHGWLIFALPPSEAAFHPHDSNGRHELYFTCDDLTATLEELLRTGVKVGKTHEERWGILASITLPGGGTIGIYQPKHPRPRCQQ
jgi:catechol 2,3-dioxygenase-like lactoylglutathione lyase family enzyme